MRVKNNPVIWFPLIIAISIVFGIIIGNHISTKKFILDKDRKINTVLNFIESEYVDTVDIKELVELAIPQLISNLDPHSYYIPAKDVKAVNDDLNMPKALALCQKALKEEKSEQIFQLMMQFNKVLGFDFEEKVESSIPQEIQELAKQRWQAKQNRDFALADNLRDALAQKGYVVKDSKEGYSLEKL